MSRYGPLSYTIDFFGTGKQIGALWLDYSDDANAYSLIPIPIAVISNGVGPTVLFTAGNHGNEYEGQVALRTIVRQLNVTQVQGRIIVLPSVNMPAVRADSRISTLDGVNLNRVFPGSPNGAPTAAIAGFLSDVVLPLCDAGVDIHTGGPLATFVPLVFLCHSSDRSVFEASFARSEAFGAPWTYLVTGIADQGGTDQEAHRQGVPFISTELGGGGRLRQQTVDLAKKGIYRILNHLGVLVDCGITEPQGSRRYLTDRGSRSLLSEMNGILETVRQQGQYVGKGETLAIVHPIEDAFGEPLLIESPGDGVIVSMRTSARVTYGDIILELACEVTKDDVLR